jgi:LysM repeat protein
LKEKQRASRKIYRSAVLSTAQEFKMKPTLLSSLSKFFIAAVVVFLLAAAIVPPVSAQASCGNSYTVQAGDYISKIAQKCGVSYSNLIAANPQLNNPSLIYTGQVLNLPGSTVPGVTSIKITPTSGNAGSTVTVSGGGWGAGSIVRIGPARANQDIVSEQQVTANGNGVISASVTIPSSAVSGEKWVVKGFIPGVGANATSNQFTVGASSQDIQLFISPVFGPAGTSVNVTGSNWPANAVVRLGPARPNSDIVSEVQATANASGSFNTKVTIPSNAANGETWVVKAFIPGSGHQKTSNNFTVSSSTSNNSYTVVRGDTLRSIARKFNVTYADLLAANPQISNPNLIFTGQKINLPAGASSDAVYHTVVKGDTLKKIAAAYGTTWDAVYALNSKLIRNPNIIYPGQVLRVK